MYIRRHRRHQEENFHRTGRTNFARITTARVITVFGALLGSIFLSSAILANPQGGQVSGGSATISSPSANTVQINQSSDKAVIDWQSFNIAPNETTRFVQPSSSSIILNRINPANGASNILGMLKANGQVWLVNPAGIFFGASARVDVAGLLATTANISNADFMAGNFHFMQSPDWHGSVINEGRITIRGEGLAALVAPGVENRGVIVAKMGTVALAAGNEFTVDFYGDNLINFGLGGQVTKAAVDQNGNPLKNGVSNSGTIIADAGRVQLTADVASKVVDNAINMSGHIIARSAAQHGSTIILSGGDTGTVRVTGKIIATGKRAGQVGGTVKVLGQNVILEKNAKINVSGYAGGGEILIGGNAHGAGPEMNADYTFVGSNVSLLANAIIKGDGGKVVVWSNNGTQFYGNIFAEGGAQGGNGGWVETSGSNLDVSGSTVNLSAANGTMGTWLLDPTNIWIASSLANAQAAGDPTSDTSANTGSGGNPNTFAGSGAISDSFLSTGNLDTALGTANVIVTTTNASGTGTGNITVVNPIAWASTNSLTLTAANNITINGTITDTAAGSLLLNAAGSVTQSAVIGGGPLKITQEGTGTVTFSQANTYTGTTTVSAGRLSVTKNTGLGSGSGAISVTSGAVLDMNFGATGSLSNTGAITLNGTGISSGGALTGSDTVGTDTLSNAITLGTTATTDSIGGTGTMILSGLISGGGTADTFSKVGSGTISLTGTTSSYTSTTTITLGTLNINKITNSGGGGGNTSSLGHPANGQATITISGGATLSDANTASNDSTNRPISIGSGGAILQDTSGTLTLTGGISGGNALTLAVNPGNITVSGTAISGTGTSLAVTGSGAGIAQISVASTYTGATTVSSGELENGVNAALPAATILTVNGGIYNINNFAQTLGGLAGTGGIVENTGGGQTLNITSATNGYSESYARNINGTMALTLSLTGTGSPTQFLTSSSSTYSQGTTISNGILSISNIAASGSNSSIGTGSVTPAISIGAAGTLQYSGAGSQSTNRSITLTGSGATLDVSGTTTSSSAATFSGGITGNFNVNLIGSGYGIESGVIGTGNDNVTKSGTGTWALTGLNTYAGTTTINAGTLSINTIQSISGGASSLGNPTTALNGTITLGSGTNAATLLYTGTGNSSGRLFTLGGSGGATIQSAAGSTGTLALSGNITNGTTPLTFNISGSTITESGVIGSGSGTVATAGTGSLTLSGTNTYTGATTIGSGTTLFIGADANLGTAPGSATTNDLNINGGTLETTATFTLNANRGITLSGGGTFWTAGATNLTYNGIIAGSGGFTKNGSGGGTFGLLILGGANTFSGQVTLSAGTLQAAAANIIPSTDIVGLANATDSFNLNNFNQSIGSIYGGGTTAGQGSVSLGSATLTINQTLPETYQGIISGTGSIVKQGGATLILGVNNSYSGTTTINAGTLSISADSSLGTAPGSVTANSIIFGGGTLETTASFTLNSNRGITLTSGAGGGTISVDPTFTTTYNGIIAGTNAADTFTQAGTGTLILGGVSTYAGPTSISAGTIKDGIANALPTTTALSVAGTLDLNAFNQQVASVTGSGTVTDSGAAATFTVNNSSSDTFAGSLTGALGLTESGSSSLILNSANSYSGATIISSGKIVDGIANALPTGTALTVTGTGTLDLNGFAQQVASVVSTGIVTDSGSAANFTVNNSGTDTYAGTLTGSLNLVKSSSGALTLNSANTYSGTTTINAGTIKDGIANALPTGTSLSDSGTLDLNGFAQQVASVTGSGTVTDSGAAATFTVNNSSSDNFAGLLSGSLALTKTAAGTLTLANGNTYSGITTINGGTIDITADSGLGTAPGSVTANSITFGGGTLETSATFTLNSNRGITLTSGAGGGTVSVDPTFTTTYNGIIAGSNAADTFTKAGTGTLILGGVSTYSGATNISAGTIQNGVANALPTGTALSDSGTLDLNGFAQQVASVTGSGVVTDSGTSAVFTVNNSGSDTFAGTLTGSLALTKSAAGTLTLNSANTYSGATTISAGTIADGIANALPTGTALSDSGTLDLNGFAQQVASVTGSGTVTDSGAAATFTVNNSSSDNFAGLLSGSLALTKIGSGTLTLANGNTYSGITTINAGTIAISADSGLGTAPGSATAGQLVFGGGTLESTASFTLNANRGIALNAGGGTIQVDPTFTLTYNGIMAGANAFTKSGTGTLILGGVSTYSGATNINAGTIQDGVANALPTGTALSDSGTLDLNSFAQQVASVTGSGVVTDSGTSAVFTVNNSGSDTFAGTLTGSLALTKSAAGTLTLNSANTYSGATTISAGTIADGIANALPVGTALSDSGTLDLNGFAQQVASVTGSGVVTDSGTSAVFTVNNSGADTFAGLLSGSLALTKSAAGTLTLANGNTYSGITTINAGTIAISADSGLGTAPGSATAGQLVFGGGTLESTASFTLNANRGIALNAGGGTIQVDPTFTLTYNGIMAGANAFTKSGTGTLILGGVSTYSGATNINAGTIQDGVANALPTG